jgi:hypothetical protein
MGSQTAVARRAPSIPLSLPDSRAECEANVKLVCDDLDAVVSQLNARDDKQTDAAINAVSLFASAMHALLTDVLTAGGVKSIGTAAAAAAPSSDAKASSKAPATAAAAAAAPSSDVKAPTAAGGLLSPGWEDAFPSISQDSTDIEDNLGDDDGGTLATDDRIAAVFGELHAELVQSFPFAKAVRFQKPGAADVHPAV